MFNFNTENIRKDKCEKPHHQKRTQKGPKIADRGPVIPNFNILPNQGLNQLPVSQDFNEFFLDYCQLPPIKNKISIFS